MNLSELVEATKGDRSYEDLAKQSGGSPGRQRWQQLATQPQKNFPDPPTIRSVAKVLDVSEERVVLAAAESLGLTTVREQSTVAALLPPSADRLTDKQIFAVVSVVRAMIDPEPDPSKDEPKIKTGGSGGVQNERRDKPEERPSQTA